MLLLYFLFSGNCAVISTSYQIGEFRQYESIGEGEKTAYKSNMDVVSLMPVFTGLRKGRENQVLVMLRYGLFSVSKSHFIASRIQRFVDNSIIPLFFNGYDSFRTSLEKQRHNSSVLWISVFIPLVSTVYVIFIRNTVETASFYCRLLALSTIVEK